MKLSAITIIIIMDLKNKNIVITGAARGLGRAMAEHFARQGANLALLDLEAEALENTCALCQKHGINAIALPANVADESNVVSAMAQASSSLGALHGLINNAGILRDGLLVKAKDRKIVSRLSLENWQAVINVNLTGVFLCGREVATHMIENGSTGVIINIASISRAGNFGQSNYSAAKAGVVALTTTWAREPASV